MEDELPTVKEVTKWVKDQHDSIGQKIVGGAPYWEHVLRVGTMVSKYFKDEPDHDMVVRAALCHDWLEDVDPHGYKLLSEYIGGPSARLVLQVTNQATKEQYPELNRGERKSLEAKRLGEISFDAMMIKLADIIDNLSDIEEAKPKMADLYKKEKSEVLEQFSKRRPYIMSTDLYKKAKSLTE